MSEKEDLYQKALSNATFEDYRSTSLLIELARINPEKAKKKLLPVIIAARIWAEENENKDQTNAESEVPEGP